MRFMSIALEHRPLHQAWHDLESFWVWAYMIIRHYQRLESEFQTIERDLASVSWLDHETLLLRLNLIIDTEERVPWISMQVG